MKTNFTKSDLKAGMSIELRSGLVGVVMNADTQGGYLCFVDDEGYDNLEYYNDDLTNRDFEDSDIVTVGNRTIGLDKGRIEKALENPVWVRQDVSSNPTAVKEPNCITLDEFMRYVKIYMDCHNSTNKAMDILFGDPALTPTIPDLQELQIEYVKMVATLLRIKDEELIDDLINWFYIDKCGQDDDPISFNQKRLQPAEVYKRVTQNRYEI